MLCLTDSIVTWLGSFAPSLTAEQDSWNYTTPDDGPLAFSSSTYVASLYKAAGLFEGLTINAQEFTAKDVYELDIYNTTSFKGTRPKSC